MVKGVVKFLVVGSVSVGLMSIVIGSKAKHAPLSKPHFLYTKTLTPDSPIVTKNDLPFKFNDNKGGQPNFDDKSGLYLSNPSNITTTTEYNPQTGNYDVTQKIGDMNYRPETYVEFQDYQDQLFKQAVKNHWKSKIKADDLQNQNKKGMIPKLTVNSELFDRIFGGNQVDIKPTGTAELIFALNRNKTLNPAIPQRQQKVTNFDFNMRIQLNLIGKIGDKLKITTSYNTEASFDWENQMKLEYTGYEDEIIKKIEAGNVSMPLTSSLIQGSQSLFGVKTQLQFGRLTATALFSQQRGKRQEVSVQGGAQTMYFNVTADNYEVNKHYFMGHYFRDNYDQWMTTLPIVTTPIIVTKVEVYITNQTGSTDQTRNFVAFTDLGEDYRHVNPALNDSGRNFNNAFCQINPNYRIFDSAGVFPHNGANSLYHIISDTTSGTSIMPPRSNGNASLIYSALSNSALAPNTCNDANKFMQSSRDFEVVQNGRKLNPSEFTFNSRLGFISINQSINNDQTVAIAYQYTYNGKVYQVGEFSDQYTSGPLYLKLLKSGSVTSPKFSTWDLMMKNVYSLGAYNLNAADFKCEVYYNNIETGVDIPYIPYGSVNGNLLVQVMGLDKLSVNGDPFSDGVFDFIPGYTINSNNGRIYLSSKEPFGENLRSKFAASDFPVANKYIYQELYDSTRTIAQQLPEKNRYKIKGQYKSASGSEISLNALNIPQGAVQVTANGQALTENVDYTVDYTLGRVKIINESILNSGANIKVSTESNSLFFVQEKNLYGARLDFKVNKDLMLGGTVLHLNEKPVTQKVNIGDEPVSNTIWGVDYSYKTDVPFLTRLIDRIPLINTKEMSSITTRGEFAQLVPGNAKAIGKNGNSYVDDFEGSISLIDLKSPSAWSIASIPQGQPSLFPEASENDNIKTGLNRAQFNWYTIDPLFYGQQNTNIKPGNITEPTFSNNFMRQVLETELFPGKTPPNGQPVVMSVLDLAFYPGERGPYNYDVATTPLSSGILSNGRLKNPETRWGGIMRRLETNDFQAANIEYVQFWMMDPFNSDYNSNTYPDMDANSKPSGELYINLGNISEDIVKDGKMCYENGLPGSPSGASANLPTIESNIGKSPLISPISNSFVNDPNDRPFQDVGYDGLSDSAESRKFVSFINALNATGFSGEDITKALNDPSSDKYQFFRGNDYDQIAATDYRANTLSRYKKYNGPEGNSPTEKQYPDAGIPSAATNNPNIEDINRDNTLSETENYYQYKIKISPQDLTPNNVGQNYIVNVIDGSTTIGSTQKNVKWYQFKVPVTEFEKSVGSIEGFNSIRFMRVFMKGFDKPVVCRIARMELVRSDWRRYTFDLQSPGEYIANDDNTTTFDVSAVSVQENGEKKPVNYVIPPNINQQQNIQTTNLVLLNEQSLSLRACNLKDGDSRAIIKNTELDVRSFGKMKLFMHAEKLGIDPLNDGDVTVFVRLGSDYNNNYYEYEIPVKLTQPGYYDPNSEDGKYTVWPTDNEFVIDFEKITSTKINRNSSSGGIDLTAMQRPYSESDGNNTITVVGNPNLASIKSLMIGIRNPKDNGGLPKCVEVWVNELRLTDFVNKGGWASTGSVQAKLADLGQMSLAATYSKPFFGSIEKKISERSRETNFQWDAVSTFQLGKFFPVKWRVNLPVYYAYGETKITPQYSPYDPDIKIDNPNIDDELKKQIKKNAQDVTVRKGYNFSNVKIDGLKKEGAKPMPWDVSNFSITYAYNEITRRNVNIENSIIKSYRGALSYNYAITAKPWIPFKKTKSKILNNKWFALVKEFNITPLPSRFGFNTDINRSYSELLNRDITSFYAGSSDNLTKAQFNKTFNMIRNYDLQWNFTKNLKFDYTANNDGRILEPIGRIDTPEEKDTIKKNLIGLGTTTGYRHQSNLNWQIPINKIPIFDFVNASAKYSTSYTWNRRPFAQESIGNTIQNTNTKNLNATLNMGVFYNKIPYLRKINTGGNSKSKTVTSTKIPNKKDSAKTQDNSFKDIGEFLARGIMMIKQVSLTYQQTNGTALPGFNPSSQYLGMDPSKGMAPGLGFVSGANDSILRNSINNGWLVKNPNQSLPYTTTSTQNITYRANVEPHGSLKIEFNGTKTYGQNQSTFVRYGGDSLLDNGNRGYLFETPNNSGNYSISVFTLGKSFKDKGNIKDGSSVLFDEFLAVRQDVARDLSAANSTGIDQLQPDGKGGAYYDGYSNTQQDVLLGAFYQTYTGSKLKGVGTDKMFKQIPLPNWTASWDGLGKLKFMKKYFQSVTLRHAYRSMYTIGGYANNLLFEDNGDGLGYSRSRVPVQNSVFGGVQQTSNFNPKYTIQGATITEAFSPLIKIDFKFNKPGLMANFEMKKDKTVNLNITGPQIIETKGQEYIVGIGYRFPNLIIKKLKIKGQPLKSDLNFKLDLSYRRNMTVIRRIVDEISTPTGGQNIVSLKTALDYQLTQAINLRLFYDWIKTTPQTSSSFPTANTNAGFSLRFNL